VRGEVLVARASSSVSSIGAQGGAQRTRINCNAPGGSAEPLDAREYRSLSNAELFLDGRRSLSDRQL